jgi:hypothetical protein
MIAPSHDCESAEAVLLQWHVLRREWVDVLGSHGGWADCRDHDGELFRCSEFWLRDEP